MLNTVFSLYVAIILRCVTSGVSGSYDPYGCRYSDQEAEDSPWTAVLKVDVDNDTADYYVCTILDPLTVMTYYRPGPFRFGMEDKLAFLPWTRYTVLIGSSGNGSKATFSQSLEVSVMQPHPNFSGRTYTFQWMFTEYDNIVIRLKTPIQFSPSVRPVCLPATSADLDSLYAENTSVIIGGWNRYYDMQKISLSVRLKSDSECEAIWRYQTEEEGEGGHPYVNRGCGNISRQNSNNPEVACIRKDSGGLVNHGGQYTFMGYVNTFDSVESKCGVGAFFYIFKLTLPTIKWLDSVLKCGPTEYTCHNGECAPLNRLCNQLNDSCADGSDEDPSYCRALNPCRKHQFECGVYGECIAMVGGPKEPRNCDNIVDCPGNDDEDELLCGKRFPAEGIMGYAGVGAGLFLTFICLSAIMIWRRMRKLKNGWSIPEDVVLQFQNGCTSTLEERTNTALESDLIYSKPYDVTHEIPFEDVNKEYLLAGGFSGEVYKGTFKHGSKRLPCAIKIPKSTADAEDIKCFLKEIKLMSHVGRHEHIIHFIGACTKRLREGILFIIVEYCELGSMKSFLTKYKSSYSDEVKESQIPYTLNTNVGALQYVTVEFHMSFTTSDLVLWASHVASGMAHLATKQVIHGDLAARNILIDGNRVAKICDFGLSHHLYRRTTYIASPEAVVPWKWMAPETLLEKTMSTSSDIWSFGITLWEMFTLGAEPYDQLEWNPGFAHSLLTSGCPLGPPLYGNSKIYEIMQRCWTLDSRERPSFNDLMTQFNAEDWSV